MRMRRGIGIILYDLPKGERNRNTTADQYVVDYPSHGIDDHNNNFCVFKKWRNLSAVKSFGSSDMQLIHFEHHSKGLYDEENIDTNILNMTNNRVCLLHLHHLLLHGISIFPYFDFKNMKFVSDRIKRIIE